MTALEALRYFRRCVSWVNIRKGLSLLRRGELSVLRGVVKNLIDQQQASAPEYFTKYSATTVRFPPREHDISVPLVTIVIPCFNYGAFVAESVKSALDQSFNNLEIIVVDGGSTDGETRGIVSRLAGDRIRVFLREDRHLAGSNRNFGIERARSPYIICLDADDTLAPTFVEKALFLAEHCGFDLVSTGLNMFGKRTGTVGIMLSPQLGDMLKGNHVYTCALFRKTMWESVGGYFDYGLGTEHAAEDWDFWIRLSAAGARISNIGGEYLLNYRVHAAGSLSNQAGVPTIEEQRERILARLSTTVVPEALKRSAALNAEIRTVDAGPTALTRSMLASRSDERQTCLLIAMPFFLVGGAERVLLRVGEEAQKAGWRVVFVSTTAQASDETDAIAWFQALTSEVYALPRFLNPRYWYAFIDYLVRSRDVNVVLVAGSRVLYNFLPNLNSEFPDLTFIDFLFNTQGHTEPHSQLRSLFSGVLCENAEVRNWCLSEGWDERRVAMVESSIDTAKYRPGSRPADLVEQFGVLPTEIVVGWSGRFSEEKSPETFVETARLCADLPNVVFVMTGGGRLSSAIASSVRDLPPGVRFHLCGVVEDVSTFFELYDICLITSSIDGRPIAALEALASGCALIASRVGGLPTLVQEDQTGFLVPPANAEAFAACIRLLVADPTKLAKMRRAARGYAEANLNKGDLELPYHEAIRSLILSRKKFARH